MKTRIPNKHKPNYKTINSKPWAKHPQNRFVGMVTVTFNGQNLIKQWNLEQQIRMCSLLSYVSNNTEHTLLRFSVIYLLTFIESQFSSKIFVSTKELLTKRGAFFRASHTIPIKHPVILLRYVLENVIWNFQTGRRGDNVQADIGKNVHLRLWLWRIASREV